jgi:hypothetical protein
MIHARFWCTQIQVPFRSLLFEVHGKFLYILHSIILHERLLSVTKSSRNSEGIVMFEAIIPQRKGKDDASKSDCKAFFNTLKLCST